MKNTQLNKSFSALDRQLFTHASAIIEYAKGDKKFAESLAFQIQNRGWEKSQTAHHLSTSPYLMPTNQEDAVHKAGWLLGRIDNSSNAKETKSLLGSWAEHYESPKDFILGIVGLAIIGPTLGIISNKKKRRSLLRVIIDEDWYNKQTTSSLTEHIQNTNMKLIAKELSLAGGNAYQLHPDTAAWCLEEPLTKLYLTDSNELEAIESICHNENISHHTHRDEGINVAISISPTINDEFEKDFKIMDVD